MADNDSSEVIRQLAAVRIELTSVRAAIYEQAAIGKLGMSVLEMIVAQLAPIVGERGETKVPLKPLPKVEPITVEPPRSEPTPPRYEQSLSSIPVPGIIVNEDGQIIATNTAADELFGRSLLGLHVEEMVPARHRKAHVSWRGVFAANPSMRLMGRGRSVPALHGTSGSEDEEMNLDIALAPVPGMPGSTLALMAPKTWR